MKNTKAYAEGIMVEFVSTMMKSNTLSTENKLEAVINLTDTLVEYMGLEKDFYNELLNIGIEYLYYKTNGAGSW